MSNPDDTNDATAVADDAREDAEFGSGFTGVEGKKTEPKPATDTPAPAATRRVEDAPDGRRATVEPRPEYVRITAKDWADVRAAAARTASYDSQFAKLFGTTGNITKILNESKGQTPAGKKIEIPKDAFAAMEKDFPELAQQTRAALEAALSGMSGTGGAEVDASKIESMLATYTSKREIEALEDAYPEWRKIVGAVDITKEPPDANNAFRKWLATKDVAYQTRINGSESAAVIGRAIWSFQNETRTAKPAATPRDEARADRIRGAVQPRGDNAGAAAGKSDDDEFLAGFNSR